LGAPGYNESKITRVPYAPVNPEFVENIITVSPVRIVYEVFAINSQSSEFYIDLSAYPQIKDPENTVIYYRNYPDQGLFIPLTTTFDSINNKLITTLAGFGELVFGVPDTNIVSNIPILYEPINQQEFSYEDTVTLRWTGKGMYNSFNIQISTDNTFSEILYESNTNLSDFTTVDLSGNTEYFWRINSVLGTKTSEWSEIRSFELVGTSTAVVEFENIVPNGYSLSQNYPNPFNSSTTISYSIQKPAYITLRIYDQIGREVKTLISKNQNIGSYSVNFNAHNLSNGIYFYKLQVGDEFVETKKMILIGK
jgi:hypothetical protein